MKRMTAAPMAMLGLVVLTGTGHAHHSHPYFYDECKSVTIEGAVERIDFKDPHTQIVVRLDDGASYTVDWAGLRGLTTRGVLDAARASLTPGARVAVTGYRMRSAAEIRQRFPDFTGGADANVLDPMSIRRVGASFDWTQAASTMAPDCARK